LVDNNFRFINRDVAVSDDHPAMGVGCCVVYVRGMENAIDIPGASNNCRADDGSIFDDQGKSFDRHSGKRRPVPAGRKFSPALARFATGGRFIVLNLGEYRNGALIDLFTEKAIGRAKVGWYAGLRHVPDRQSFVAIKWPSPLCLSIPASLLDPELARLFAEVVSCHELDPGGTTLPLDEAKWDERRRQLARRLDGHAAPFPIGQPASDRWYWLRRQADRAGTEEEKIKYLDRLIAMEPTWQNYQLRAHAYDWRNHYRESAMDILEAGKRAGRGYWHHLSRQIDLLDRLDRPTGTPEDYQVGLRLAEPISAADPEDREYRIRLAIALYRVSRYAEALSLLEGWQRDRERTTASKVGQFFLLGPYAALLESQPVVMGTMQARAFRAMTYHSLGQVEQARAALADFRALGNERGGPQFNGDSRGLEHWYESTRYRDRLREAEALIEGRPQPGK